MHTIIIHNDVQLVISNLGYIPLTQCIAIHLFMASVSLPCVLDAPTATEHKRS